METGLLLLRTTVGLTLAAHAAQKLFGWFGGPGLDRAGQGLERLGFHPGRAQARRAGLVEAAAGVLLTLGLLTPAAAMLVASVMLVAGVSAHLKGGFFLANGGYEYNVVLGVAGLTLAFTGPGAISLDALIGTSVQGLGWGFAALVGAVAGGAVQLTQRRAAAPIQAATAA